MNKLVVISLDELKEVISEAVKCEMSKRVPKAEATQGKEYLTRSEVKSMLKVDLSTIHNWCKKSKLKPHAIGNRIYFLRSEVESAIIPLNNK